MIDIPLLLRTDLLADPAISALVGDRIWASRTSPMRGWSPQDGHAICVSIRGGSQLNYVGNDLNVSVQVQCYGSTEFEANRLYRAVFDRLHVIDTSIADRGPICHTEVELMGQPLEEQETEWPFVLGFFKTIIRNI